LENVKLIDNITVFHIWTLQNESEVFLTSSCNDVVVEGSGYSINISDTL